jgi:hypothetical protein
MIWIRLFQGLTIGTLLFTCCSCSSSSKSTNEGGGSSSGASRYTYETASRGAKAIIVRGKAVAPEGSSTVVKRAIEAGNRIVGKPYRRGGGHGKLEDSAYDCSGTVSYVLCKCGLLDSPTTSTALRKYGESGEGKNITIYARDGHTFMTVAGLRLDTTGGGDERRGPRWSTTSRSIKGFRARHAKGT